MITGCSSGIGRALAIALAEQGALLAVSARRESLLRELAAQIIESGAAEPVVLTADLTEPGEPGQLATRALEALGQVDIVINNAGVGLIAEVAEHTATPTARASFETNFWAPVELTSALLPSFHESGGGTIVNVTSTVQAVPLPLLGYYAAANAALAAATRSLRNELRHTGVRVVEVVPGSTDTALRDIDQLPWRHGGAPPMLPPVPTESVAAAIVRGLRTNRNLVVHPKYSLLPLELPLLGRLVAWLATRRINLPTKNGASA